MLGSLAAFAQQETGTVTVTPETGPIGTQHILAAKGLTPSQEYTAVIRYNGEIALEFAVQSDAEGYIVQAIYSEPGDPLGEYVIEIVDGETVLRSGVFSISEGAIVPNVTGRTALAYNETVEGRLTQDAAQVLYTFDGAEGDIVSMMLRSRDFDAFLSLNGPDGGRLRYNDNGLPPTDAAIYAYTLEAAGTYSILVTSRDAAESGGVSRREGAYALTLSAARPAQDGEIGSGETVVGVLDLLTQNTQYMFFGQSGDVVTIDLRSEAFDSVLRLFMSDGSQIAQDDDGGGGLNARISRFTLPADGEYFIVVDGFRGFTGERRLQGSYTVSLEIEGSPAQLPQPTPTQPSSNVGPSATTIPPTPSQPTRVADITGAIDFGETIIGEMTPEGQLGSYTFTGARGEVVTIALDSSAFDPFVTLLNPAGDPIAEDDDSGPNLNALLSDITLPDDGEYVIVVDGFRGASGTRELLGQFALTLTRSDSTAQPTPEPTALAPEAATSISIGQTLSGEFGDARQDFAYTFEGRAGDVITIDLNSREIDPLLRLIGPDGDVLAEDDDSGGGVQARIADFTLPTDGTYTIEADAFRGIARANVYGAFTLTLSGEGGMPPAPTQQSLPPTPTPTPTPHQQQQQPQQATPAPIITSTPPPAPSEGDINPKDTFSMEFTGAADEAFSYSFSADAGDMVSFSVFSGGAIDTVLEIYSDTAELIAFDDDSGPGFDPELLGVTLPDTGPYEVVVRPLNAGASGTAVISFDQLLETALDGPLTVTLNDKYGAQQLRFDGEAGETIRMVVTSLSQVGGAPEIVVSQGGDVVASQHLGQNLRLTFEFTVPRDGRVDVKILRNDNAYGEIQISIERLD